MPTMALPRLIEEKFDELARHVRRLWLFRGLTRVALIALLSALALILLDRSLSFGPIGRWIATLSWVALIAGAIVRYIVKPQRQVLDPTTLAAAIETQFPSLSERLITVVERTPDSHGSKPLMELLVRDTLQRTKRLNFDRAAPIGPVVRGAVLTAMLLGISLLTLFFVGGGLDRVKRLLLPWYTPQIAAPFVVKVSSGSVTIRRGESVTLTGYLERQKPDAMLPTAATLIAREKATGTAKHFPMTGDDQATFHVTRPAVAADFDYRIEAGGLTSDWRTVTVADPVELADGTTVTLTPPAYAMPPQQPTHAPGFPTIESLQHSDVQFEFHFNRPASAATLEWLSATPTNGLQSERLPLALSEDRKSARLRVSLFASGNYRLTLQGEHDLTTTLTAPARAIVDQPPKFEHVGGLNPRAKEVQPAETIILDATVTDDVAVDRVVLEYVVNDAPPVEVPLAIRIPKSPRAECKYVFSLSERVKEGDTLRYRLRASDGRSIPALGLKPQVAYFPEREWVTLRIKSGAESLEKQEILSQQDAVRKKLDEALSATNTARRQVERVRREAGDQPMLHGEDLARLQEARAGADKAAHALDAAAEEAALTPELRSLAEAMRALAAESLRTAEAQVRRAENDPDPKTRAESMAEAEKRLAAARDRIEALQKQNDILAQNRVDKRRLEMLADEVRKLAAESEKTTDPKQRDDLLRKLEHARAELRDVINGNSTLRHGAETAANDQARALADEASKLRDAQRKLDEAITESEATNRRAALAPIAAKQKMLRETANDLRERTAGAARLAGEAPLDQKPFDAAQAHLRDGDAVAAMTEQEKAARDLERLADGLEKAAALRKDPREAAKQLAALQENLRQRIAAAAKQPLSDAQKTRVLSEQAAIRQAIDRLAAPPNDTASQAEKAAALKHLKEAQSALEQDVSSAEPAQRAAAEALKRLSETLPTREERFRAARTELEHLQREQDALAREVEEKLKPYDRRKPDAATQKEIAGKLDSAAKQQAELAERIAALDAPGFEARRQRTVESARRAADDLRDGLPQDIPASQADLKRRLAHLRTALDGGQPSDTVADELARRQSELADRLQRSVPDATALGELQRLQREIADRIAGFRDPDGAERLTRARQSVEAAARQFKDADDTDQLRKKSRQAAKDLDDLADHLAGVETDRERVERLAKQRRERAEQSKANAAKPTPAEEAEALAREIEQEFTDLKQTRSGTAQEAKKSAIEQLERLKRTPNPERAPALQKAAADALDELAKKMKRSPEREERLSQEGDTSGDAGGQLPSQAEANKARELARRLRDLRDATAKAAGEAQPDPKQVAEQTREQQALADKARKLADNLRGASQAPTNTEPTAKALNEAAEAASKAQAEMDKARQEQAAGRSMSAGTARQNAMQALDEAKTKAGATAVGKQGRVDPKGAAASQSAAQANALLREAAEAVVPAPSKASTSIAQAAGKISDAADHLSEANRPRSSDPGSNPGNSDNGKPLSEAELPLDLKQYAGTPWGELPGDVKNRIIQDLTAKYGEDYARAIKLYFETLADKK